MSLFNPQKTAVVVIDLQKGIVSLPSCKIVKWIVNQVEGANRLLY